MCMTGGKHNRWQFTSHLSPRRAQNFLSSTPYLYLFICFFYIWKDNLYDTINHGVSFRGAGDYWRRVDSHFPTFPFSWTTPFSPGTFFWYTNQIFPQFPGTGSWEMLETRRAKLSRASGRITWKEILALCAHKCCKANIFFWIDKN